MLRRTKIAPALGAALLAMGACGWPVSAPEPRSLRVALAMTAEGAGDLTYNDAALAGLDRARKETALHVIAEKARANESDADRVAMLERLVAGGTNLVVAMGPAYTQAAIQVARAHPNVRFMVIDPGQCLHQSRNLVLACFPDEESGYLVGAAAALKSKSGVVGFIGSDYLPNLERFLAGYKAGAVSIKPTVKMLPPAHIVESTKTTSHKRSEAEAAARQQLSSGADVVFVVAGRTAIGAVKILGSAHRYVIGVGSDAYYLPAFKRVRENILTSALKRVDLVTYRFVTQMAWGKSLSAGAPHPSLNGNDVGFATSGTKIKDIKNRLNRLRLDIIDQRVKVPRLP